MSRERALTTTETLTPLQERFAANYARQPAHEKDATKALREAGSKATSPAIRVSASRLLRHPDVQRRILELDPRHEIARAGIDAAWLLNELAGLWDVPLEAIFDEEGQVRPIHEMSPAAQKLISSLEIDTTTRTHGDGTEQTQTRVAKVKLVDRMSILRDIGKHVDVAAFQRSAGDDLMEGMAQLLAAQARAVERANQLAEERDITLASTDYRRAVDTVVDIASTTETGGPLADPRAPTGGPGVGGRAGPLGGGKVPPLSPTPTSGNSGNSENSGNSRDTENPRTNTP